MGTRTASAPSLNLLVVAGPLPALAALIAAIVVEPIPVLTILAVAAIAYVVFLAGVSEAKKAAEAQPAVIPHSRPLLELMDTVPLTSASATLGVVRAAGVCPLGYRPGSTWAIDRGGHLTPQLCRPAVEALSRATPGLMGDTAEGEVSCQCPLGEREVVFALRVNR